MRSPIHRRTFLQTLGLGTMGAAMGALQPALASAVRRADPIRITRIESVRFADVPWMWIRLHTDRGLVGTGETYTRDNAQEGALIDFADQLLGRDARDIERIWNEMYRQAAYNVTGGAEMRIISAVNIALYDILGQALGVPVYQLMGAAYRMAFPSTRPHGDGSRKSGRTKSISKRSSSSSTTEGLRASRSGRLTRRDGSSEGLTSPQRRSRRI